MSDQSKLDDKNGAASQKPKSAEPDTVAAGARTTPRTATVPPSQVQFDTTELKSSYCNVCNGSSTREEVVINFGVNESWDMGREKLLVMLQHRVVMSPYAAKRLRDMMNRLIDEHETKYGKLDD